MFRPQYGGQTGFVDKTVKGLYNTEYRNTAEQLLFGDEVIMKKITAFLLATVIFMLSLPTVNAAFLVGDANGDGKVSSLDAAQVLKHDVFLITLEGAGLTAADVNADGRVDSLDAAQILKYDANIIDGFGTRPDVAAQTAEEWLSNIVFGINYFNGINENNDNDAYFKWISQQGFNGVEIGCRYAHLVDGIYGDVNTEYIEKLKSIIDYAYKYDFYIILTLYDGYEYEWTSLNYDNQDSIIKMINTSYKKLVENLNGYDDRLAISFCSEPRDYTDNLIDEEACTVLNNVNKEFVKMVRSTGGNNLYRKLAITTGWSKCNGLAASRFEMVDDEYTFVRIHLYQPGVFTGSKTEEAVWDEVKHQLTLTEHFKALKNNFIDKDIPVYIGEFGCRPKDNDEERVKWAQCYLSLANSYNVKCFIWDTENKGSGIANSFAISNKQKLQWLNPVFMNYILDMYKNNSFTDYYDTYSYSVSINDPIETEITATNLLTGEERVITAACDADKLVLKDGKYCAKEPGEILFTYTVDGFNYYYNVKVTDDVKEVDFELELFKDANTGYLQLRIITNGFSKLRLDYDWSSTNEGVAVVSKYSTITVLGDGECSIIAKNKESGAAGRIDLVIANNEIVDIIAHAPSIGA